MVRLLYFGRLTDVTTLAEEELDLPGGISTGGGLRTWLDQRFSAEGVFMDPSVRIAVNATICTDEADLSGAREIAFLPPVGGG